MRTATNRRGSHAQRLAALVVALCLTGAGCLFCCGQLARAAHPADTHAVPLVRAEAASDGEHVNQSIAVVASSAGHSCCRAKLPSQTDDSDADATNDLDRATDSTGATDATKLSEGVRPAGGQGFPRGAPSCCVQSAQALDAARKPRPAVQQQANAPARESAPEHIRTASAAPDLGVRQRLPDRGGTYLRVCVLLI
jgi:hypothetical protein